MPPDVLKEKRLIAEAVESAVENMKGVSLIQAAAPRELYPLGPGVPGVGVLGPDTEGRYEVTTRIAIARIKIPKAADALRAGIWGELRARRLDDRVKSVDISVEDLMVAI